ncbi:MAG: transposase [Polyangiaceae bacterium]
MAALAPAYRPRKPTETLLYGVVREHLATFLAHACETYQAPLPRYVQNELRGYLRCGVFAYGFVRAHCDACGHDLLVAFSCKARAACPSCAGRRMANTAAHLVDRVLPSVPVRQWVLSLPFELRRLAAFDAKMLTAFVRIFAEALADRYRRWGVEQIGTACESGAITFVQRFGSSLNLNVHFHVVMLDGVFVRDSRARAIFHHAPLPSRDELEGVVERTRCRIRAWLARHGYVDAAPLEERTNELPLQTSLDACADIAMRRGTVETNARWKEEGASGAESAPPRGADAFARDGFNLHASVRVEADDDLGRERLCRYGARPPFSLERLRRLPHGELGYRIKKTRGGSAKVLRMTPLELLARLAALVPPPRYPLVRYHGVLAPRSPWRKSVVPRIGAATIAARHAHPEKPGAEGRNAGLARRDAKSVSATRNGYKQRSSNAALPHSSRESSVPGAMLVAPNVIAVRHWERLCGGLLFATSPRVPWATLLRRTFEVDVLTCAQCAGRLRILGAVEDPVIARDILERLGLPIEAPAQVRARDPTLLEGDDEVEEMVE